MTDQEKIAALEAERDALAAALRKIKEDNPCVRKIGCPNCTATAALTAHDAGGPEAMISPLTDKDIRSILFIIALDLILFVNAMIFRTDEIIRQLKISQGLPEYKHLAMGWRANVSGVFWLLYLLISGPLISLTIYLGYSLWRTRD